MIPLRVKWIIWSNHVRARFLRNRARFVKSGVHFNKEFDKNHHIIERCPRCDKIIDDNRYQINGLSFCKTCSRRITHSATPMKRKKMIKMESIKKVDK